MVYSGPIAFCRLPRQNSYIPCSEKRGLVWSPAPWSAYVAYGKSINGMIDVQGVKALKLSRPNRKGDLFFDAHGKSSVAVERKTWMSGIFAKKIQSLG